MPKCSLSSLRQGRKLLLSWLWILTLWGVAGCGKQQSDNGIPLAVNVIPEKNSQLDSLKKRLTVALGKIQRAEQTNLSALLAEGCVEAGNCFNEVKAFGESRSYFERATEFSVKAHRPDLQAAAYNGLADIYFNQPDKQDSIVRYRWLIENQFRKTVTPQLRRTNLLLLGGAYYNLGMFQKAKELWQQTLALDYTIGSPARFIAITWNNLTGAYLKLNQYNGARYSILKGLAQATPGDNSVWKSLNQTLAEYYLAVDSPVQAIKTIYQSYTLIKGSDTSYLPHSYELLADASYLLKRYDSANYYQRLAFQQLQKNAEQAERNTVASQLLNVSFDYSLRDYRNRIIQAEQNRLAQARRFILAIGVIILLTLIVLVIVYQYRQIHRRSQIIQGQAQTLDTQKQVITQALHEKEVLLREIHHRVKNNLQVILSLLDLQLIKALEKTTKDALNDARSRVHTISLIHQQLYQQDNLAAADWQLLSERVIRENLILYGRGDVTVRNQGSTALFDADTAIPLSLILNELVTNSLKHAFAQVEKPYIALELTQTAVGEWTLGYSDNGPGLPADQNVRQRKSLGIQLLINLSRQLRGRFEYQNNQWLIHFKA